MSTALVPAPTPAPAARRRVRASTGRHKRPPRSPRGLVRLHRSHRAAPGVVASVAFGVLAIVRVGGAWNETAMVAAIVLTPATVLLVSPLDHTRVGLCRPRSGRAVLQGVGVVLGSYVVTVAACTAVFGADGPHNWLGGIRRIFDDLAGGQALASFLLAAVCMGLLIPLAEEVWYRGVLHDAAALTWGPATAVVITAIGWALVHLGDYGLNPFDGPQIAGMLPSVALMGLALGWCRVRTGSALACAAAQGVANLALTVWVFVAT